MQWQNLEILQRDIQLHILILAQNKKLSKK